MLNNFVRALAASFILVLVSAAGFGQTSPSKEFAGINIKNFGKMDERFYRGAQPKPGDYAALKALGVKTVIDLQAEPTEYEKREVEAMGMRYVNVPIVDKAYPTQENIDLFLKTVDDPETGVFYAHCAGGRHRTGDMGALYRFAKYGWGYDQAYQEMKNYDFYSSWGHGKQKEFVADFAAKYESSRSAASTTAGGGIK
jgi:tyrosine-protein phosphatase SIW14